MADQPIKVFISYRRDDGQYVTDSIHDHLVRHFGEENVFLDVESIPFGVDFRQHLANQVAEHDAVVVVIGPDWARIMQERAHVSNDFVRIEIESALQQQKLIIPVLVMEATMPDFGQLPASISDLQWLQSAIVRRKPDLEPDCSLLAEGIRQYYGLANKPSGSSPKFLPSDKYLPAPFDWVSIPAGKVTLEDNKGAFDVPAFDVAKYPITVAHYKLFMQDDGYANPAWWTEAGWEAHEKGWGIIAGSFKPTGNPWIEPCYWQEKEWQSLWKPDHPIVGISWYEAYAFTQWLSAKTGETIHLPTEQQWQWAVQGGDGRTYPWGKAWDASRCNNDVVGRDWQKKKAAGNMTTPVTRYTGKNKGDSPVDMAGNVCEWTLSAYDTANEDIDSTNRRVRRGGSWSDTGTVNFRCGVRSLGGPNLRVYDIGFRVARSK